jgi:flagellar export protein FliJ
MPKFVFQLQAVLVQRRAIERARTIALASIERERLALEQRIRDAHEHVQGERAELREQLAGANGGESRLVDLRGVRFQAGAAVVLAARTQQLVLQLAGLHKGLEKAREELRVAVAARKAVELLREERYAQWLADINRSEAMMLDELATMRAGQQAFEETEVSA